MMNQARHKPTRTHIRAGCYWCALDQKIDQALAKVCPCWRKLGCILQVIRKVNQQSLSFVTQKSVWLSRKNHRSVKVRRKRSALWRFPPRAMSKTRHHPPLPRRRTAWDISHHVIWSWFHLERWREKRFSCKCVRVCLFSRNFFFQQKAMQCDVHHSWRKNHYYYLIILL